MTDEEVNRTRSRSSPDRTKKLSKRRHGIVHGLTVHPNF